jgi:hypothetical protein
VIYVQKIAVSLKKNRKNAVRCFFVVFCKRFYLFYWAGSNWWTPWTNGPSLWSRHHSGVRGKWCILLNLDVPGMLFLKLMFHEIDIHNVNILAIDVSCRLSLSVRAQSSIKWDSRSTWARISGLQTPGLPPPLYITNAGGKPRVKPCQVANSRGLANENSTYPKLVAQKG